MHQITTDEGLRIGELAERAGLSVRTLHHYDRIGLVRASERTEAGHRRYSEADVRRLYQVVALPLARRSARRDRPRARGRRVHAPQRRLGPARRGRGRAPAGAAAAPAPGGILEVLERSDDPSIDELTEVMEVVTMHERFYTPGQLEALERRREELGDEQIRAIEREWAEANACDSS